MARQINGLGLSLVCAGLMAGSLAAADLTSQEKTSLLLEAETLQSEARPREAETKYLEVLSVARQSGDRPMEAAARKGLGSVTALERMEGLAHYRLALRIYQELGDAGGEAEVLQGMGEIYVGAGFGSKAIEVLSRALEIEQRLTDRTAEIETQSLLGAAYQTLGLLEDALAHLEQAGRLANEAQGTGSRVSSLLRLGSLYLALGRYEDALPKLEEARARLEREAPPNPIEQLVRMMEATANSLRESDPLAAEPGPELATQPPDPDLLRTKLEIFAEELEERSRYSEPATAPANLAEAGGAARRKRFLAELGLKEALSLRNKWVAGIGTELRRRMAEDKVPQEDLDLWAPYFSAWLEDEATKFNEELLAKNQVDSLEPSWFGGQARELRQLLVRRGFHSAPPAAAFAQTLEERLKKELAPLLSARTQEVEGYRVLSRDIRLFLSAPQQEPKSPALQDIVAAFSGPLSFKIKHLMGSVLEAAHGGAGDLHAVAEAQQYCSCSLAAYDLLGLTYDALDRHEQAKSAYEKAWDLYAKTSFPAALSGEAFEPARRHLRESVEAGRQLGLPAPFQQANHCLRAGVPAFYLPFASPAHAALWEGSFRLGRGEVNDALSAFRDAVSEPNLEVRAAALTGLGAAHEKKGQKALALKSYWSAVDAIEHIQGTIRLERLAVPFVARQISLYDRVIRLLVDLGQPGLAFEEAERARARVLLNQIGNRRIRIRQTPPELANEWYTVRQHLVELQSQRLALQSDSFAVLAARQLAEVAAEEKTTQAHYEALLANFQRQDPEYAAFVGVTTSSLSEIQTESLGADTTLVEYFVLADRVLAWAIDRTEMRMVKLPVKAKDLSDRIRYLLDLIAARQPATEAAGKLRADLFAPLEPYIRHRNLVIVPHGSLHYLPFGALWQPKTGRYLIQDYRLTLAPSASVLRFVLKKRNPFKGRVLVLGDPDGSLPEANKEARAVAALYGQVPLLGSEAREIRVHEAAAGLDILHLATHAVLDPLNSHFSRIQLAPGGGADSTDERADGWLHLHEIYNLDLAEANLVVLSACRTSLGEHSAGDEVVSLSRAFLYAGAPAVMTSLWEVDDAASGALLESFYRHLRAGLTTAAALQVAQVEAITSQKWQAPYFWAAFTLTGDPQGDWEPLQ
ncbi:MAG TPA: CHAT domain-containing tetratricopeptide repeat protein [Thermoanaerobaculia bacterium]|nr:CHAT domain-containing tetratricopeptide repeat protein [Thermoanaerobaculia bacterium]